MRKRLAPLVLSLLCAFTAATPRVARAQNAASVAAEHYDRGTKLFDLRRYKEAAHEYELAYESRELPELLFDIAQAYRFAAMYEEAIASYRAFLRREPRTPNRSEVEDRIHEMQALLAQARKTKESPPQGMHDPNGQSLAMAQPSAHKTVAAPVTPVEPAAKVEEPAPPTVATVEPSPTPAAAPRIAPRKLEIAGLVTAGLGVAAIGVGAAFAVMAKNTSNQVSNSTVFSPTLDHQGKVDQGVAIGMLAGGGALVVGGAVVAILGLRSARASRFAVAPSIGINHAGAVAAVKF